MKSLILSTLLFLVLTFCIQACGKVEQPQFRRFENFGVRNMNFQQATVGFSATFFNPNRFGLSAKEAALDIYVDSTYLGKFIQPTDITVNSGVEFSIPLEGTLSLAKVLSSQWKRMLGKEVLLKANGDVKVGKGGVFITRNIAYQGRYKLDMDLIKNPAGAGL